MAGKVQAGLRVCGRMIRYATVVLGLLAFGAIAGAQQVPDVPVEVQPGWDTKTAPAKPAKAVAKLKDGTPKGSAGTAIVLPALTTKPEGMAGAETPQIVKRGHKGDPVVLQSELPPAVSDIVTGAIGTAGDAKGEAAKDATGAAGATAQSDPAKSDVTKPASPEPVTIGFYVNDLQDIDFRTNSYIVDLYMWFRWKGKGLDPVKSVEFMNVFDPQNSQRSVLLDAPKEMPDGSLYNIVRYHGRFSKKFLLEKYPFDVQKLDFVLEDSVSPSSQLVFVPDTRGIGINPKMSLPGFKFGEPALDIASYTYPTDFGDLSVPSAETYSRVTVTIPINRPVFTLAIKTFGPILLIVICSTLVFFINPHFVEGRIGLAITALLTLVAIQFTAASSQPDADYFTMLDKLYMLSYAFIIASLVRVVTTSWQTVEGSLQDHSVSGKDHRWGVLLLVLYAFAAFLIASWVLSK